MSDHVSVLGNEAMLMDVIRIATGADHEVDDVILSEIDNIAAGVEF